MKKIQFCILCLLIFVGGCGGSGGTSDTSGSSSSNSSSSSSGQASTIQLVPCSIDPVDNSGFEYANGGVLYSSLDFLRYYDIETTETLELVSSEENVTIMAPSSSRRYIAYSSTEDTLKINITDLHTGEQLPISTDLRFAGFAWSPDDAFFTALTTTHIVRVNVTDGVTINLLDRNVGSGRIIWAPDGARILLVDTEQIIVLTNTGEPIETLLPTEGATFSEYSIRFSPNGRYFTFLEVGSDNLYLFDIEQKTTTLVRPDEIDFGLNAIWSPTSEYIAVPVGHQYGSLLAFDVEAGTLDKVDTENENYELSLVGFRWAPSGNRLAYSAIHAETLETKLFVADLDAGYSPKSYVFGANTFEGIREYRWSPDGKYLAAIIRFVGQRDSLHVIDLDRNCHNEVGPAMASGDQLSPPSYLEWSPSGKYLKYNWYNLDIGESVNVVSIDGGIEVELMPLFSSTDKSDVDLAFWHPTADALYFTQRGALPLPDIESINVFEIESMTNAAIQTDGSEWFADKYWVIPEF